MTDNKLLSIYLNDHLAAAAAGTELARRTLSNNEGTDLEEPLTRIAREIEEDKTTLEEIMASLAITKNPLKEGAAWLAEKAGRLKLNGQITGYSPLSRVIEFEALVSGITGKLALWQTLKGLSETDMRLDRALLDSLITRAETQRDEMDGLHDTAAQHAFVGQPVA